jgi:hypothetical protein
VPGLASPHSIAGWHKKITDAYGLKALESHSGKIGIVVYVLLVPLFCCVRAFGASLFRVSIASPIHLA